MEKLKFQFNYKGYIVIIAEKDGVEWIYPIHEIHDLKDDSAPTCLSVADCLQWIDEDIRCRTEESGKECFNHCPKCNATDPDIEWGDKEWFDTQAYQEAVCKKCDCHFKEYYQYSDSEIVGEV